MVKKIPKRNRQVIWRWKYTTNHCQVGKIYIGKKNIYWEKKEKASLFIPIEKNQKTRNWLVKRKKKLLELLSYNAKSAQY